MANTWPKLPLTVVPVDKDFLSYAERDFPEGASQTFLADSPLKISAGKVVEWVSKADALVWGWALQAGKNTTGATTLGVLALNEFSIAANLLAGSEVDRAYVATDLGVLYDLVKGATNWYVAATTSAPVARVSSTDTRMGRDQLPNVQTTGAQVGDINPRVLVRLDPGSTLWY
jgi:hypothetical protein